MAVSHGISCIYRIEGRKAIASTASGFSSPPGMNAWPVPYNGSDGLHDTLADDKEPKPLLLDGEPE